MSKSAEVIGNSPTRWNGKAGAAVFALVVAVAAVAAIVVRSSGDGGSPGLAPASPSRTSLPSQVLAAGRRNGVNTDRDHDRFTYAISVHNVTDVDVTVDSVDLVPATGLRVELATLVSLAEFDQVWDPTFEPSTSAESRRLRSREERVLLLRVAVDCHQPPAITALRVRITGGGMQVEQELPASESNGGAATIDLSGLPRQNCS